MEDEIEDRNCEWARHVQDNDTRYSHLSEREIIDRRTEIHPGVMDNFDKKLLNGLAHKIVKGFGLPRNYPKGLTKDERMYLCECTRKEKKAADGVERSEFFSDFGREVRETDLAAIAVAQHAVRRRVLNPRVKDRIPREIVDGCDLDCTC